MFERELIDAQFVKRWSIVRTLIPQSIAEHTFLVTHYANDIALYLGLSTGLHLRLLQRCIWHDARDEIFTSDLPGPNKRGLLNAIGPDAKGKWSAKLQEWAIRTFSNLTCREGGNPSEPGSELIELILKTADWLEAATRMATENQMGNMCATRHIVPNTNGAIETAKALCEMFYGEEIEEGNNAHGCFVALSGIINNAVFEAHHGQSAGPWITKEDDSRAYYDACVDTAQ